jgi:hypothetical protein
MTDRKNSISKVDEADAEKSTHIESPVTEIGTFRVVGLSAEDADFYVNYPEEKRKKVFRKVCSTTTNFLIKR